MRHFGKRLSIILLIGLCSGQALAEANEDGGQVFGDSLGFHEVLELALKQNPELKSYRYRYEAAMNQVVQVTSLPDPMLQVTHFVESVQTRTGPQENVFMLSQRLPWFGKLDQHGKVASAEAKALWFAFQSKQLDLVSTVAEEYYQYAYLLKAIELAESTLTLLEDLEPVVEEKVRGGDDLNSLLRLKVETGKINDRLQSYYQERITLSARLRELLGEEDSRLLPWPHLNPAELADLDGMRLASAVRKNHPLLKMLEQKLASAEAREALARLEKWPDVTLGVNYIQLGESNMVPRPVDSGTDPWGVMVSVNLPIWRDRYSSIEREALANKRVTEGEYESTNNRLLTQLSVRLAKVEDANRRRQRYGGDLLGMARQAVEISRTSYEAGRSGILEVIDSERTLLDLELLYWRAVADTWIQQVGIQALTNQPISGEFQILREDEEK